MRVYLFLFIILFANFSCRKLVKDEFPEFSARPTLNSILISGKPVIVQVSLAEKMDTSQLTLINNAEVLLYADEVFMETLASIGGGLYSSSFSAEPLKTYRCEVNIPGYPMVSSTDSIPEPANMFDIIHINKAGKDEEGVTYPAIKFTFTSKPAEKQYFEVAIRIINSGYERLAFLKTITDPVILNEGLPLALFCNDIINDPSYTMTINYTTGSAGSSGDGPMLTFLCPLIVELRSVSYNYYQFVRHEYLYEQSRFPEFLAASVTAFPHFSNIKGGYGIFAGYSAVQSDTIFPKY
jgi:hypothetical protein